jgi:hypothetical protein
VTITEDARHRLYQRLEEVLGEEQATTLMEHLPPVGWADVATKNDIAQVHAEIAHLAEATAKEFARQAEANAKEFDHLGRTLRLEMHTNTADLRTELHQSLRLQFIAIIGANVSIAGVALGAVTLFR